MRAWGYVMVLAAGMLGLAGCPEDPGPSGAGAGSSTGASASSGAGGASASSGTGGESSSSGTGGSSAYGYCAKSCQAVADCCGGAAGCPGPYPYNVACSNGACIPGSCSSDSDCSNGTACYRFENNLKFCVLPCTPPGSCTMPTTCSGTDLDGKNYCKGPGCQANTDCKGGGTCVNGSCVCTSNDDCTAITGGVCVF